MVRTLEAAGYDGWYVLEQDVMLDGEPEGDGPVAERARLPRLPARAARDVTDDRPHFEVLTMGRVGVDIYPEQVGVGLEDVTSFGKYLGGSPTNVAVAAARHGRRSAVITRTGADPFGRFIHQALRGLRRRRPLRRRRSPACPTPVTFCEIFPPDDFPLYFYRLPKAPDLEIHADELDLDAIRGGRHLLGHRHRPVRRSRRRAATMAALRGPRRARHHRPRPRLPADVLVVARRGARARSSAAVALRRRRGRQPRGVRGRGRRARAAARPPALLDAGRRAGRRQAGPGRACSASRGDESVVVPPVPVDVVNGLGAGDAFGGALCHGLLAGWDLERIAARSPTPPARSSPAGWPAPTPCRPPPRSTRCSRRRGR